MRERDRRRRGSAWRAIATLAAAAAIAGCGSNGSDGPQRREVDPAGAPTTGGTSWTEPSRYAYTLLSTCGERNGLGLFRVWVNHGSVDHAKPLDHSILPRSEALPTIGDVLQKAVSAREAGADIVRVVNFPTGQPRWVSIDYSKSAIDDEACWRMTDLKPGGG